MLILGRHFSPVFLFIFLQLNQNVHIGCMGVVDIFNLLYVLFCLIADECKNVSVSKTYLSTLAPYAQVGSRADII